MLIMEELLHQQQQLLVRDSDSSQMSWVAPYAGPLMGMMMSNFATNGSFDFTAVAHTIANNVPGYKEAQAITNHYLGIDLLYLLLSLVFLNFLKQVCSRTCRTLDRLLVDYCMTDVKLVHGHPLQQDVAAWIFAHTTSNWRAQSLYLDDDIAAKRQNDMFTTSRRNIRMLPKSLDPNARPNLAPTLGRRYFFPLGWRPFIYDINGMDRRYSDTSYGPGHIIIRCFGWSEEPLQAFFKLCKAFSKTSRHGTTTVTTSRVTKLVPKRRLSTVEIDKEDRESLLRDITEFFRSETLEHYRSMGMPYRRGYLLHGLPGTGKSSLSLALAGHFDLELISINLGDPAVDDHELAEQFATAPSRCIVLMEDVDSAGIGREKPNITENDEEETKTDKESKKSKNKKLMTSSRVTLSGLLNVLDGVAAEEGRLVILTSNNPEFLDSALIRPGRIDRRILLPAMSSSSISNYFLRFFARHKLPADELEKLSHDFANQIPDRTVTPAELQSFLLMHLDRPDDAIAGARHWAANVVGERKIKAVKSETDEGESDEEGVQYARHLAASRRLARRMDSLF